MAVMQSWLRRGGVLAEALGDDQERERRVGVGLAHDRTGADDGVAAIFKSYVGTVADVLREAAQAVG